MNLSPLLTASGLTAYMLILLGCVHVALWWRNREPGMLAMGAAGVLIGVFYGADALQLNVPNSGHFRAISWSGAAMQIAVFCWTWGMAQYLGLKPGRQQPLVPLLLVPNVLLGLLQLGQFPVARHWGNVALTVVFVGMAVVAWQARQREKGAGLGLIAASILFLPISSWCLLVIDARVVYLRYVVVPALLLMYLVQLTVIMRRRRRALEAEVARRREAESAVNELNATLETRIAERTADLNNLVAGLESFNRSVSHDLRGPLGGIENLAQIGRTSLQRGDADATGRMLEAIEQQARHSHELVAALLDLARVNAAELQRGPVSLHDLVGSVIQQCRLSGGVPEHTEFQLLNLTRVHTDAALVRLVLTNLIGNACKFSAASRPPQVEVSAHRNGLDLTVQVRDNGVGLNPQASGLFQPFQRLHDTLFQGHGVGLSIVRRAVARLGGEVWVQSQPGQGATFAFSLPGAVPPSEGDASP